MHYQLVFKANGYIISKRPVAIESIFLYLINISNPESNLVTLLQSIMLSFQMFREYLYILFNTLFRIYFRR